MSATRSQVVFSRSSAWAALAAAALVEEHDAPLARVEVAPVDGIDAAARTAVQKTSGLPFGLPHSSKWIVWSFETRSFPLR
jgi:hypothetical protein